jgi:uncharacterized protein
MKRVVLDTNILVSAMLTPGRNCASIVRLVRSSDPGTALFVSHDILFEYARVLRRPHFDFHPFLIDGLLENIRTTAHCVYPARLHIALPDPTDLPFLEVAAMAQAVLVTGNTKHFPPDLCSGITVCTPADFMELLSR